ncbi:response regulator [Phenylobacterium sp. LjRoot164]|uniref:ATP-binding protein n=1 Tax=unclassified Phenylobacterium TaxID=2640670 RepID=UPI003ECCD273
MADPESQYRRVVVLAPIGRDGSAIADVLRRVDIDAELCRDLPCLVDEVTRGTEAVLVAEEALFGKDLDALADWVANQPAWSDLPFVILTSRHDQAAVSQWRRRLVETLRNVSLLERPVQSITLSSAVQAALRARQRQYEVRELIAARERAAADLEQLVVARTQELEAANRELTRQMDERLKVEETLRQAQKIEAIGQLTGGVAHDFNNLLMVISGGLDMLGRTSDSRRRERLMAGMRQAAQRGSGLTRQLLAFSRRQPLSPEPVDLARQIGGMSELLDRSLRGDVQVRLDFAKGLWPVEVDPGELELVVLNLAVNARDAMPTGGTITVRARNLPAGGDNGVDCVEVAVIDAGVGIPEDVLERVFDPFFTTKDIGKGSGLGLAQVHGFAVQSGGSVRIESQPGEGTSVILLLPRSARQPAAVPRHLVQLSDDEPVEAHKGSVLLVEDDDEVAALVSEMLAQLGYAVTRAASAQAALGAMADSRSVDIVFSDIMMPGGMNGVELAREVRRRRPGLPVLLTSGYAEAAQREAEAAGVAILPKPYQVDDLAMALHGALCMENGRTGNGPGQGRADRT